jgi:hypothetical protein
MARVAETRGGITCYYASTIQDLHDFNETYIPDLCLEDIRLLEYLDVVSRPHILHYTVNRSVQHIPPSNYIYCVREWDSANSYIYDCVKF